MMLGVYLPTIQHILGVTMFIRLFWVVGIAGILHTILLLLCCCLCVSFWFLLFLNKCWRYKMKLAIFFPDTSYKHITISCCNKWSSWKWWSLLYDIAQFGSGIRKCGWHIILFSKYCCCFNVPCWWCRSYAGK